VYCSYIFENNIIFEQTNFNSNDHSM